MAESSFAVEEDDSLTSEDKAVSANDPSRGASLIWAVRTIDELSARELHALMKLRVDVFVVEQACAYPEVDELDALPDTLHLLVLSGSDVIATARAMAPEPADRTARIGRVAVHPSFRGQGLARQMMIRLMQEIKTRFGAVDIVLGAQTVVVRLYEGLGFEVTSAAYLEDGIEHVDMRYSASDQASPPPVND